MEICVCFYELDTFLVFKEFLIIAVVILTNEILWEKYKVECFHILENMHNLVNQYFSVDQCLHIGKSLIKVQNRLIGIIVIKCGKFIDAISDSILQQLLKTTTWWVFFLPLPKTLHTFPVLLENIPQPWTWPFKSYTCVTVSSPTS